jgi:hypothetical protein
MYQGLICLFLLGSPGSQAAQPDAVRSPSVYLRVGGSNHPCTALQTLQTSQSGAIKPMSFSLGLDSSESMAYRATMANVSTLPRPNVIRADPTMTTCFDPADKELYDLWAPAK